MQLKAIARLKEQAVANIKLNAKKTEFDDDDSSEVVLYAGKKLLITDYENGTPEFDVNYAIEWPEKDYKGFKPWMVRLKNAMKKAKLSQVVLPDDRVVKL